jgi:hypothetical protein
MPSRADQSIADGTVFASIRHGNFSHSQFSELLSLIAAKAGDMQAACVGMDTVSQYLDEAADAMDSVYAADPQERGLALVYSRTEDDKRESA